MADQFQTKFIMSGLDFPQLCLHTFEHGTTTGDANVL
jgi:hypothetical protein